MGDFKHLFKVNRQRKETRCEPSFETWPRQETRLQHSSKSCPTLSCPTLSCPRSGNEEKEWAFSLKCSQLERSWIGSPKERKKKMLDTRILHFPGLATFQDTKQSASPTESAVATQSGHRPRSFKNTYKREYPNRVTNHPSMPGTRRASWYGGFWMLTLGKSQTYQAS